MNSFMGNSGYRERYKFLDRRAEVRIEHPLDFRKATSHPKYQLDFRKTNLLSLKNLLFNDIFESRERDVAVCEKFPFVDKIETAVEGRGILSLPGCFQFPDHRFQ